MIVDSWVEIYQCLRGERLSEGKAEQQWTVLGRRKRETDQERREEKGKKEGWRLEKKRGREKREELFQLYLLNFS